MSLSKEYEDRSLAWTLAIGNPTRPTAIYVGLYTSNPTDAGGGTEVSGPGYVRQEVTFPYPDGGVNPSEDIVFPVAEGEWGTITAMGFFDAQEDGNLVIWEGFEAPLLEVTASKQVVIRSEDLTVTAD